MRLLHFLLALLAVAARPAVAQIVTPNFAYYDFCPNGLSQVEACAGWYQPTGATSDYFNACAAGTDVGVPQNFFGYQAAAANAYTGMYVYMKGGFQYREYIATHFAPLTVGQTYTMTVTVSLADSSSYATDGLGVFFSTYPVNHQATITTLPVSPQIDFSSYGIITDKENWVTLTKTFVADSAYTHLTLGCFKGDATILVDSVGNGSSIYSYYSYYYIGQIGVPGPPPVDTVTTTPADTTKYNFPTAFTPNGNGNNDVFRIVGAKGHFIDGYTLHVFNRYGQRVFSTDDPATGWNGTFNNVPADVGTYFYLARFTINGKRELVKGDVTLIR